MYIVLTQEEYENVGKVADLRLAELAAEAAKTKVAVGKEPLMKFIAEVMDAVMSAGFALSPGGAELLASRVKKACEKHLHIL